MERNEEVEEILDHLSDIMAELPSARYCLEDALDELENENRGKRRGIWEWDDARAQVEKAEENWERLVGLKEKLEKRAIGRLGGPGTLTIVANDTTVVVLLDNKWLVNGEIVDDVEAMVYMMYDM